MSLNLVSEHLLAANGLSHQDLFSILGQLTERRLDYGDLYFQSSYHESWVLEDSIIKDGSYNIDQGVGVRAVSGEKPVLPMPIRLAWRPWSRARRPRVLSCVIRVMAA
jgi:microcin-processing peptidase 2. Unknown type peptidase. MEROPS family U62